MAHVRASNWSIAPSNNVIDLTLSDSEDCPSPSPNLEAPPSLAAPFVDKTGDTITNHGLLLDGDFAQGRQWGCRISRPRSFRVSSGLSPIGSSLDSRLKSSSYIANFGKRRRVERVPSYSHGSKKPSRESKNIPPSSQAKIPDRTFLLRSLQPSSNTTLAEAVQLDTQTKRREKERDEISESLTRVLREQVFPHINQRLGYYQRSIDSGTRKDLGKKAAWQICGDEFLDNLEKNNGRLSPTFEGQVAAIARTLVDQFANDFTKSSQQNKQGQHSSMMEDTSGREDNREPNSKLGDSETSLENKTVEERRRENLSMHMKARWARGEMDSVLSPKVTKKAQKKSNDRTSYSVPRRSEQQATGLADRPVIVLDSSSSDDQDSRPSRLVCLNVRQPSSEKSLTPSNGQISRFYKNHESPETLSSRPGMTGKAIPAKAVSNRSRQMKTKYQRKHPEVQIRSKPVVLSESLASRRQIEMLQLGGLDERISRPYLGIKARQDIQLGIDKMSSGNNQWTALYSEFLCLQGSIVHVDFCLEEINTLIPVIEAITGKTRGRQCLDPRAWIQGLLNGNERLIPNITSALYSGRMAVDYVLKSKLIKTRTKPAILAFLGDAAIGALPIDAGLTRLEMIPRPSKNFGRTQESLDSLIRQREIWGRIRNPRVCRSFKTALMSLIEDKFVRQAEWTDCAGDVATITWIDSDRFCCGATAHSDEHNMQYNKPGNLLVGSVTGKSLNSVAGHQVVRPIVTKGENSGASMRETQDPWMYCSVTSTAYSHKNNKLLTGSYDQTVKVWDIAVDGSSLDLCGVWRHSGNVNFVVASPHHSLVATAADVCQDAVRIYKFDESNVSSCAYKVYEASVQCRNSHDTWAYFPATMQWGISSNVTHLLLVGYSPRSFNCNDADIPEDQKNTGELCLWDTRDGSRVLITSARTQNVFEVVWHPTQPIFVAATSPTGNFEDGTKTQLRVFGQTASGTFNVLKTLDCPAKDINEITVMPNSRVHCYVTASCTNGKTYVWDSSLSDEPIHTLHHGESIDEQTYGTSVEETDSGVKFSAWGKTSDRFYTGSSDGVVKAWNIRASAGQEFIRDVIILSGGVSAGKFSPDFSKLVLGDSTGKVHILSLEEPELDGEVAAPIRRPIAPHLPLPAPLIDDDDQDIEPPQTARQIAQQFLDRGQIIICPDEYIGAIQGQNYASTGLFYDPAKYKGEIEGHTKGWSMDELREVQRSRFHLEKLELPRIQETLSSNNLIHENNLKIDLDVAFLPDETRKQLEDENVDLHFDNEHEFAFEPGIGLGFKEDMDILLEQHEYLEEDEIQDLLKLEEKISRELAIQRRLEALLL